MFWAGNLSKPEPFDSNEAFDILTKVKPLDLRALRSNRSRRSASVEIEVGTTKVAFGKKITELGAVLTKWSCGVVQDGSLPPGGFEINAAPACGDALIAELTEIGQALENIGAGVTGRCGLHVHVDTRDFMYQDIQRLAALYAACEWALFASCSHWRIDPENHYCTPCGGTFADTFMKEKKDTKEAIMKTIYGAHTLQARDTGRMSQGRRVFSTPEVVRYAQNRRGNIHDNRNRYWSLNLHSFFMRGTVESRMRHGSVNAYEMIMWARLWESIVDFAFATPQTALTQLLQDAEPYDLGFKVSKHLAASIAGAQAKPKAAGSVRLAAGSKLIFQGVGILSSVLPNDVFQWFVAEIHKFNEIKGDQP